MTFQPIGAVAARIMSELYEKRANRLDEANANLREFVEREDQRIRDLEARHGIPAKKEAVR